MGALASGTVIAGRYRLDRLLGEGGMGAVWSATHSITGGRVALKFIKSPSDPNGELRRRFLREARIATLLEHPNVVTIRDVLDHDDTPVIVMDLLHGETLAQRVERQKRLTLAEAARIVVPVIGAVGAAHEAGLIHRDLKPENVFLCKTPNGEVVRVLDFGIAKLVRRDPSDALQTAVTQSGAVVGTPAYMAPEQLFGERDLDHRVDVWSIGVILHEMLSGERPVDGENYGQIAKRLLSQKIPTIAARCPDLPREVANLVDRMLAREREDRLADLREAVDLLAPYAAQKPPSFGPPRTRPVQDSDPDARVVVGEVVGETAANPSAPTEAFRKQARDVEALATQASATRPQTEVAHVTATHEATKPRGRGAVVAAAAALIVAIGIGAAAFAIHASHAPSASPPSPPPPAAASTPFEAPSLTPAAPFVAPPISVSVTTSAAVTSAAAPSTSTSAKKPPPFSIKAPPSPPVPVIASVAPPTSATTPPPPVPPPASTTATGLVTKPPF